MRNTALDECSRCGRPVRACVRVRAFFTHRPAPTCGACNTVTPSIIHLILLHAHARRSAPVHVHSFAFRPRVRARASACAVQICDQCVRATFVGFWWPAPQALRHAGLGCERNVRLYHNGVHQQSIISNPNIGIVSARMHRSCMPARTHASCRCRPSGSEQINARANARTNLHAGPDCSGPLTGLPAIWSECTHIDGERVGERVHTHQKINTKRTYKYIYIFGLLMRVGRDLLAG